MPACDMTQLQFPKQETGDSNRRKVYVADGEFPCQRSFATQLHVVLHAGHIPVFTQRVWKLTLRRRREAQVMEWA